VTSVVEILIYLIIVYFFNTSVLEICGSLRQLLCYVCFWKNGTQPNDSEHNIKCSTEQSVSFCFDRQADCLLGGNFFQGAVTLSITIFSLMTLNIMKFGIMTLSIMALNTVMLNVYNSVIDAKCCN
jgi:hypothetical protein